MLSFNWLSGRAITVFEIYINYISSWIKIQTAEVLVKVLCIQNIKAGNSQPKLSAVFFIKIRHLSGLL